MLFIFVLLFIELLHYAILNFLRNQIDKVNACLEKVLQVLLIALPHETV